MPFRITEIWAFTSIDEAGEEGIVGLRTAAGWLPLVAADKTRLEQLVPHAAMVARMSGRDVHLSRFSVREDIMRLTPPSPPAEGFRADEEPPK